MRNYTGRQAWASAGRACRRSAARLWTGVGINGSMMKPDEMRKINAFVHHIQSLPPAPTRSGRRRDLRHEQPPASARALPLHLSELTRGRGWAQKVCILATHRWRRGLEEGRACGTLHSPPVLTLFALLESDSLTISRVESGAF